MKRDKKFSFVIPYTDKDKHLLNRCVASIEDQDYGNLEIIKVHDVDKKGACWARNTGAAKATGDYLFFFDVDCVLMPGILMQIKAAWEDDPTADFIYGQYRFFGKELDIYPSRAWNPYVLETMNYITTMSPMKREMFDNFRGGLPYFQDWDFFLRAVKRGKRGKFLKTIFFQTNTPDKDSISGDPTVPFWEKVREVQKLNGIGPKPIALTTFGAPFQGEARAEVLGADYLGSNMETDMVWTPGMWGSNDYKMIYVMGFYPKAVNEHCSMFQDCPEDAVKVIHWIGTDVYQLRTVYNWESIKALKEDILVHVDHQFTTSPWLTEELAELGIDAPTVYAPIDAGKFPQLAPPKQFTVGCYVSDTNPVHNEEFLIDVAKAMPDVKFIMFGRSIKEKHRNVEYVGRVSDMRDVLKETSCNLRMTVHDGLPQTCLQYLMSGRQVVCNSPIEYARFIDMYPNEDNYSSTKARVVWELRQAKNAPLDSDTKTKQRIYWVNLTSPEKYKAAIEKVLNGRSPEDELGSADVQPGAMAVGVH